MKSHIILIIISGIICLILTSCQSEENCKPSSTLIRLQVLSLSTGQVDTLAFNQVQPIAASLDSLLYTQDDTLTLFTLPLALGRESVSFRFDLLLQSGAISRDTLTLCYNRQQRFEGKNCGLQTILDNLSVKSHSFDSVAVLNNIIEDDEDFININIYR